MRVRNRSSSELEGCLVFSFTTARLLVDSGHTLYSHAETMSTDDLTNELAEARRTIRQQEIQLAELRDRQADMQFADSLRELLLMTATASTIAAPAEHNIVLDDIVQTAADVMRAQAASLFVLDEDRDELVFHVALGEKAETVKNFRVPLGRGIAGYVALTGQPIAIADAAQDPRFAQDIGQAIG